MTTKLCRQAGCTTDISERPPRAKYCLPALLACTRPLRSALHSTPEGWEIQLGVYVVC